MKDLNILDKGKRFIAKIKGIPVKGKIQVEDGEFFLCTNEMSGKPCNDKLGYKYSYTVSDGSLSHLKNNDVTDFKFGCATAKEIEEYKDFQLHDILINKNRSFKREVVGVISDSVIVLRDLDGSDDLNIYLRDGVYSNDWRLDEKPEEEAVPVEMSVAEVATKLGLDPKTLKIVDK